jgi:hypothetical protein
MVAIIGGDFHRFRPLVDLYRESGRRAGHAPDALAFTPWASLATRTMPRKTPSFRAGPICSPKSAVNVVGHGRRAPSSKRRAAPGGGAFPIGDPRTVRNKILDANKAFGGLSRITFQMSSAMLETEAMQRSIALLGSEVAPAVEAALHD